MKFHAILMSTAMVQALQEGIKTETRRIVKPQPNVPCDLNETDEIVFNPWVNEDTGKVQKPTWLIVNEDSDIISIIGDCRYGGPNDVLWVRETWSRVAALVNINQPFIFKAAIPAREQHKWAWHPSIHMPKAACRFFLQVAHITVERLHDISEQSLINEGVRIPTNDGKAVFNISDDNTAIHFLPEGCLAEGAPPITQYQMLFAHYAELWCKLHGRESWDSNPWVWVIKFKQVERPELFLNQ